MWKLILKFIKIYLWPLVKRKVLGYFKSFITKAIILAAVVAALVTVIIMVLNRF